MSFNPTRLRRRGPLVKPCRTCHDLQPVTALSFGHCGDCAPLVALPARGAGGRFTRSTAVTVDSMLGGLA